MEKRSSRRSPQVPTLATLGLLDHMNKSSLNPFDLDQWRFFVVPTP